MRRPRIVLRARSGCVRLKAEHKNRMLQYRLTLEIPCKAKPRHFRARGQSGASPSGSKWPKPPTHTHTHVTCQSRGCKTFRLAMEQRLQFLTVTMHWRFFRKHAERHTVASKQARQRAASDSFRFISTLHQPLCKKACHAYSIRMQASADSQTCCPKAVC